MSTGGGNGRSRIRAGDPRRREQRVDAARPFLRATAFARRAGARAHRFEREHRPLIAICAAYVAAAAAVDALLGGDFRIEPTAVLTAAAVAVLLTSASAAVYACWVKVTGSYGRGGLLRARAWRDFAARHLDGRWFGGFIVITLLVGPFRDAFLYFKRMIPVIHPFAWDRRIADWDRTLHLGHDPWTLLAGWLGHPLLTNAIDVAYHLWFPLGVVLVAWQAFTARDHLRMQFLVSYMLIWMILGTGAATLLSSAGPCYYGLVTGDTARFAPLLDYLARVHEAHGLLAVETQRFLWAGYQGRIPIHLGISAMPSIHVALAVLYAILGWKTSPWLGGALTIFAVVIELGSVHLGWHYALDGYVSILATPLLWAAAGRLVRWYDRRAGIARAPSTTAARGRELSAARGN
ncbi:MAG TPA: phosphatase PAP2 family protein [Longimicrobiales bacterium]